MERYREKERRAKVSKEIIHYMLRAYFSIKKRKIVHLARKGMSKNMKTKKKHVKCIYGFIS